MTIPQHIAISDYTYILPEEKIALYPLSERDASKILVYEKGMIREDIYKNIHSYLPENGFLVFNNTKVIKARMRFQKSTGSSIEIFCLEPHETINDYSIVMQQKEKVQWKCMIGGVSKWKEKVLTKRISLKGEELVLQAMLIEKNTDAYIVQFSWRPSHFSFAEIIESAGDIPLPPYIKRENETTDEQRYQTIYAQDEGSVAAPTAGLHFSKEIFSQLAKKNIQSNFITLHVGAGTFKPVKAATMAEHEMHGEWMEVTIGFIEDLLFNLNNPVIAVGTTATRTLESLYWMGVKVFYQPFISTVQLQQWEVYEEPLINNKIGNAEALSALMLWMKKNDITKLFAKTHLLIVPGYRFKIVKAIVTNFHQPQSTLLLLVATATGKNWEKIYTYALQNDFRFLSYGDGSLLFIDE